MAGSRYDGFTLIEVLVALALVAVTLAAAARAVALSTHAAEETRLRVLAGFVAENRVTELAARRAWPSPGLYEGTERQADIEFAWRAEVQSTPHPAFRRIEIRVVRPEAPEHELRRLVAVLPKES